MATPLELNQAFKNVWDGISNVNTNINIKDAQNVKITGNQSISGIKIFSDSPIVPTPITNMQASTKKYVDDAISGIEQPTTLFDLEIQDAIGNNESPALSTSYVITLKGVKNLVSGKIYQIRMNSTTAIPNFTMSWIDGSGFATGQLPVMKYDGLTSLTIPNTFICLVNRTYLFQWSSVENAFIIIGVPNHLYNNTGQSVYGPMTQKATTDAISDASLKVMKLDPEQYSLEDALQLSHITPKTFVILPVVN